MDKSLKLRHYLKAYHHLPDFPRADDILFELQNSKYANGESFNFLKIKDILTFKIDKNAWEKNISELINTKLIEKVDKNNYRLLNA